MVILRGRRVVDTTTTHEPRADRHPRRI